MFEYFLFSTSDARSCLERIWQRQNSRLHRIEIRLGQNAFKTATQSSGAENFRPESHPVRRPARTACLRFTARASHRSMNGA